MPLVDVVIVNYNGGHYLRRALDALQAQTFRDFRVIVVDNASTDDSLADIPIGPIRTRIVHAPGNLGFAGGNNLAFRQGLEAKWVALLNPDAFPREDWLERLMDAAATDTGHQFFGCRMLNAEDGTTLDGAGDVYHVSGMHWRDGHGCKDGPAYDKPVEIFGPCGAAALYRSDDIRRMGGFDEDFFCYAEDVDLAFRMRLDGLRCRYVPDAVVEHVGSGIVGVRSDFARYHAHRNLVWTYVKNMPGMLFWVYLPYHLLLNVASLAVFTLQGRWIMWRAKRDALLGLRHCLRKRRAVQSGRRVAASEIRRVLRGGLPRRTCRT